MPKGRFPFTSESVSEGHPDKVSDRISDAVLDAYLTADPYSRVACETLCTTNRVVLTWKDRQCEFDVTLPPENPDEIPRVGPLLCKGVAR